MKQLLHIFLFVFSLSFAYAAPVPLPFTFESGSIVNGDFLNFDGGTATVVANPFPGGINTTATVGRMVRNGGQPWAGAFLTTPANVDFSTNPIICMKVYTRAPVGTRIALKMEGCGGGCSREIDAFTTVSGAWETICYDFTGEPTNYNRVVFLFDLGNVGNGTLTSTFLFDDVEQRAEMPLPFTPGSQYFCPNAALTLTFPGPGTYNWYSDPAGTTLVQASSSTYNTPVLTESTSYYVRDMASSPFPATDLGPNFQGGTAIGNSVTVSTFFTSNLDNGLFHSIDIVFHIPTGPPPANTCTYRVDLFNLTQGTSRTLTQSFVAPVNFSQHAYAFGLPLPIFLGDQLEMRITSITGHPCYCISSSAGDNGPFLPFPNSNDPQITFTGHTSNGTPNVLLSGIDYRMSGDFVDPSLSQVNAIADCAMTLPVKLLKFSVEDAQGDAQLDWMTASEVNNDYFLVKRSTDGILFETIAIVKGQGNSSTTTTYSYTDSEAKPGLSYYQLEQVDFDGSKSSSGIVSYEKASLASDITMYPNPSNGMVKVKTVLDVSATVGIEIQDFTGKTMGLYNYSASAGSDELELDIKDYPAGVYAVIIQLENGSRVFKLVKH